MIHIDEILKRLSSRKSSLFKQYAICEMGVFGSLVKGEQHADSDVDVLVEFTTPPDLWTFLELEGYLEDLLGLRVDLVRKKTLRPELENPILSEVLYL